MDELITRLVENCKKNKTAFKRLKDISVITQDYELAAKLRHLEKEIYPDSEEIQKEKELAKKIETLFRMSNLNVNESTSWLIYKLIDKWKEIEDKTTISDVENLISKQKEIFD